MDSEPKALFIGCVSKTSQKLNQQPRDDGGGNKTAGPWSSRESQDVPTLVSARNLVTLTLERFPQIPYAPIPTLVSGEAHKNNATVSPGEVMRSCVCTKWGPPSALSILDTDHLLPPAGKGEVAIAVHACAVNFPDVLLIQGKYQVKPKLPFVPGSEVAGVVTDVGEGCTRFRVGDRVVAFVGYGGFATDVIAIEKRVLHLPPAMDFKTASSFLVAYGTADYALRIRAGVKKGDLVLILGASGGVGLAAVQLAKAAGATVVAAASTAEKLRVCRDSGADLLLNYRESERDWRGGLKRLTELRGVDVVVDNVGGSDCEIAMRSLAVGGRYLVIGFASGAIPSPPLNLVLLKEACVMGIFWGAWVQRNPEESAKQVKELVGLYRRGLLRPVVSRVYPLEDTPRALEDMEARKVVGKVVIEPRSTWGRVISPSSSSLPSSRL